MSFQILQHDEYNKIYNMPDLVRAINLFKLEDRGRKSGEHTKPNAWYINFKYSSYPGIEHCSITWVFKERI
jgi:hypothetical protein